MLTEGVDVKSDHPAVWSADLLLLEVHGELGVGAAAGVFHQRLKLFRLHLDGQNAVLEAVVVEDVCEAGRDDAAYAEVEQCPRRMLAAGATPEVVAHNQNLGVPVRRLVEDEIRVLVTVLIVSQFIEERLVYLPVGIDGFGLF